MVDENQEGHDNFDEQLAEIQSNVELMQEELKNIIQKIAPNHPIVKEKDHKIHTLILVLDECVMRILTVNQQFFNLLEYFREKSDLSTEQMKLLFKQVNKLDEEKEEVK